MTFLFFIVSCQKEAKPDESLYQQRLNRFWERAIREVYKSSGELKAQDDNEIRKGEKYRKLIKGNTKLKHIALTFDDGPHPDYTLKLLKVLKKYNVKATFFVVGKMAEKYPELIKAEYKDGHTIGNHSFHHACLTKIPEDEVPVEWQACNDVVKSIVGIKMTFCRPPGGDYDKDVIDSAMNLGLTTVLWTDDPADYGKIDGKVIEDRVIDNIENGGIILLHDGIQYTIDVLPRIIEKLKEKGFKFVSPEDMLNEIK